MADDHTITAWESQRNQQEGAATRDARDFVLPCFTHSSNDPEDTIMKAVLAAGGVAEEEITTHHTQVHPFPRPLE